MSTAPGRLPAFVASAGLRGRPPKGGPVRRVSRIFARPGASPAAPAQSSGRKSAITITNDKGRLSKEEIEKMVKEAEEFAAADELMRECTELRGYLEACLRAGKASPPPPGSCLTNVVRHDVLFSVSDTVCVLRFNRVWHRE